MKFSREFFGGYKEVFKELLSMSEHYEITEVKIEKKASLDQRDPASLHVTIIMTGIMDKEWLMIP